MAIFDSVQNIYETLIYNEIKKITNDTPESEDSDFLEDIACVALNKCPSHYIRYAVDEGFYRTASEQIQMRDNVKKAVEEAYKIVTQYREGPGRASSSE